MEWNEWTGKQPATPLHNQTMVETQVKSSQAVRAVSVLNQPFRPPPPNDRPFVDAVAHACTHAACSHRVWFGSVGGSTSPPRRGFHAALLER